MIQHSPTITKLMGAMLAVQGAVEGVSKNATNPHFKRKYASLESVVDTIRPECQKNGIVVMQAPGACRDGVLTVETFIAHAASGEWIRSASELPVAKADPQGAGSAITYAERYSLMALFNLPPIDDDGEAASRETFRPQRPAAKPTAAAEPPQTPTSSGTIDLARSMADEIARTGSLGELDDLRQMPTFLADWKRLDAAGQNAVRIAGERQRAKFLAPVGGG